MSEHTPQGRTATFRHRLTRHSLTCSAAVALAFLMTPAVAKADVLVSYPFTANTSAAFVSPIVATTSFDSSHLNPNPPTPPIADDGFGNVLEAYPMLGSTSAATALANNSYFTISLTARPGSVLDLDSLAFEVGKGGNSDPRGFFVRTSVDNFASNLFSETLPAGPIAAPVPTTVPLSNASFQGLSSITFRFYVWTPDPTNNSVDFRNLSVNGPATAVPEPSSLSLGLLTLGAAGLAALRRRRAATGA
jgi:hypothetical protein